MPEMPSSVEDALEGLTTPSAAEVLDVTRWFPADQIASVGVSLAMAGGGSQTVLVATKHISAADFLSASTVYPVVIAGVAGKAIVPISGIMQFNAGGTPFVGGDETQQLYDLIPADSYAIPEFPSAIWGIQWNVPITSTTDFVKAATINDGDQFALLPAQASGKALVFSSESPDPTEGDGTADLTVLYYLATIL